MSRATTPSMPTAAWRLRPAGERWQAFQAQLPKDAPRNGSPWTRRSTATCAWRVAPARVSAGA